MNRVKKAPKSRSRATTARSTRAVSNSSKTKHLATLAPTVSVPQRSLSQSSTSLTRSATSTSPRNNTPQSVASRRHVSSFSSIAGTLLGKTYQPSVSLDHAHPFASLPSTLVNRADTSIKSAVLDNGIKVLTTESTIPISHINVDINVGSRYENPSITGITNFMERSILRSTTNRDVATLIRDLGKLGADISTTTDREVFSIAATTPTKINPTLGAIRDIITFPAYTFDNLARDAMDYNFDNGRRATDHHLRLSELTHQAAYGNRGLGQTIFAPDHLLSSFDTKIMKEWHTNFFTADRMTISAVGVNHDSFVDLANEMFGGITRAKTPIESPTTEYIGGDLRQIEVGADNQTYVALAWAAPELATRDAIAANVLQTILGGGESFSAGGPGKGLYTRLYRNVLAAHDWISDVQGSYDAYTDSGLLSVSGTIPAHAAGDFVDIVLREMSSLTKVTDEEVGRAKNMLRASYLAGFEHGETLAEEMTSHLRLYGKFNKIDLLDQLDSLTTQDIQATAGAILSSPITVATIGDSSYVPSNISM